MNLLDQFHDALVTMFDFLAPNRRLELKFVDNYEPINSPQLPVRALLIGDQYAAFMQMWQHKHGADESLRVEKFKPWIDPKGKIEDPHKVCAMSVPLSCAHALVTDMLYDFYWPMREEWKKKQPWYKPKEG